MRINVEPEDVGMLVIAYERQHRNILDEMMSPGMSKDELAESVEFLKRVEAKINRFKQIQNGRVKDAGSKKS